MVEIDLSECHGQVLDLAPELHASDAPKVRFAYRGLRLAPLSGLKRADLIAVLGVEPAPVADLPAEAGVREDVPDEAADPDAPTDVVDPGEASEDPPQSGDASVLLPPPSPVAAAILDALGLQMHVIDVLASQDFRLEHLGAPEVEQLTAASAALARLEPELGRVAGAVELPAPFRDSLRKIGRELSSLATQLELTVASAALALESDAASDRRRAERAKLELQDAQREDVGRGGERARAAKHAPAASSAPPESVKLGRLRVRFSASDVRALRIVAFAVMPALLLAVVLATQWCHSAPSGEKSTGTDVLASVQGHSDGKSYVVTLSSWSGFESERARLTDLTKAIAARGYESARFENAGHTVAVWEQGQLRAGS